MVSSFYSFAYLSVDLYKSVTHISLFMSWTLLKPQEKSEDVKSDESTDEEDNRLRAFRCRFHLRFFSVTLCKYRSNNTFGAKNELSSASRLRARIKLNFNFKSTHSLSKFTKSDDFTTILFQIEISTNFRIRKYQKYFWNDRPVKIYTKL